MYAVLTTNDAKSFWESGQVEIENLVRAGLVKKGARVLDYGAGLGRLSIPLARHAVSVVGADVSLEMLSRLARNPQDVPNLRPLHIVPGQPLGCPYDLVVSFLVFQHMPPYLARCTFRSLVEALADDGRLAIDLPVIEWESKETAVYWPRVRVSEIWTSRYYHSEELDGFLFRPAGYSSIAWSTECAGAAEVILLKRSHSERAAPLAARARAAAHKVARMASVASGVTSLKRTRKRLRWVQHTAWTALSARVARHFTGGTGVRGTRQFDGRGQGAPSDSTP
jgi:SAM-dependent methyltransferase